MNQLLASYFSVLVFLSWLAPIIFSSALYAQEKPIVTNPQDNPPNTIHISSSSESQDHKEKDDYQEEIHKLEHQRDEALHNHDLDTAQKIQKLIDQKKAEYHHKRDKDSWKSRTHLPNCPPPPPYDGDLFSINSCDGAFKQWENGIVYNCQTHLLGKFSGGCWKELENWLVEEMEKRSKKMNVNEDIITGPANELCKAIGKGYAFYLDRVEVPLADCEIPDVIISPGLYYTCSRFRFECEGFTQ